MIAIEESARDADVDDIDVIEALHGLAVDEVQEVRGGPMWTSKEGRARPAGDGLRRAVERVDEMLVAGLIDGVVVGYAVARLEGLHDGGQVAVIDDLYVMADARGVGVGEAILDHCIEWARAHRCVGLDSQALPGDRHTKNFFESFGMVARAIVVHRSLNTEDP